MQRIVTSVTPATPVQTALAGDMKRDPPWLPFAVGLPLVVGAGLLWLGLLGVIFQGMVDLAAVFTGDGEARMLFRRIALWWDVNSDVVRLVLLAPVHLAGVIAAWPLFRRGFLAQKWVATRIAHAFVGWQKLQVGLAVLAWTLSLGVTTALVVQPGLEPLELHSRVWLARTANLLDGTASLETYAMGRGLWLRFTGAPIPGEFSVTPADLQVRTHDGPVMARWDPLLREATSGPEHFAQTKAFMWVESAGRQFAVSRTGCAGLYQFCTSTAQRRPFEGIFGVGAVAACSCGARPCRVEPELRDALETDAEALEKHDGFPCSPTDARFDPERAIPAGAAYVQELSDDLGGNLLLMYIGYNSGPAVAKRLKSLVGTKASLDDLRPHLATVLARWYGASAEARADGLLEVHLPKLQRAYEKYR